MLPQNATSGADAAGDSHLIGPLSISRQTPNDPEQQPLIDKFSSPDDQAVRSRYGSIVGSPASSLDWRKPKSDSVRFELPDPTPRMPSARQLEAGFQSKTSLLVNADNDSVPEAGESKYYRSGATLPGRYTLQTLTSLGSNGIPSSGDLPIEAYREIGRRQAEFFDFLDSELEKIESFYKVKEDQATERLGTIREQLHIMRDCHIEELVKAKTEGIRARPESGTSFAEEAKGNGKSAARSWLDTVDNALETARHPSLLQRSGEADGHRDYVQHSANYEMPYRTAKFKLKAAMHEFYRGLELLKSYALLNRKAFRKMNKKFDKAANAPPTLQYMSDKVNEAYFVKSHVLGGHIRAVEDLYARYFEGGNYKVATSKLRATTDRPNDYNGAVFRSGLMAATGLWFGIEGLSSAKRLLYHPDPMLGLNTSYLLQVSIL